jgi:hypothetical protein
MLTSLHSPPAAPAAHSPHGPYCPLSGQWPSQRARAPAGAVGDGGEGAGEEGERSPRADPSSTTSTYVPAPGLATLCGVLAAFALVGTAALGARAAPDALRLLAVLNVPAALRALTPAGLCAASGVCCATLALVLAHRAALDADGGLPRADGRSGRRERRERSGRRRGSRQEERLDEADGANAR